jgi:hypothetical protein
VFRLRKPVDVPVTLEQSTGSSTTTVTGASWPVTPRGAGPMLLIDFRLGWMINPRLSLLADLTFGDILWAGPKPPSEGSGWRIESEGRSEQAATLLLHFGVSAQLFVTEHFWVRPGFGLASATYDRDTSNEGIDSDALGAGGLLGLGFEVSHRATARKNAGLSLEVTGLVGPLGDAYGGGAAGGLAYQWY